MIPFRYLKSRSKTADILKFNKSYSLYLHELILIIFWGAVFVFCFLDETKLGLINFYRKHLPAGLLLLPIETKIALLIPILMFAFCLVMITCGTSWEISKAGQSITRYRTLLFGIKLIKNRWLFSDIAGIRITKAAGRKSAFLLILINKDGKSIFVDRSKSERKLKKLAGEILNVSGHQVI